MTRRSARVSGSAGGSTGSVPGSGDRAEVGNEFGRRPGIAVVDLHETAVRIDHDRSQAVCDVDGALRIVFDVDTELSAEPVHLRGLTRQKGPDLRVCAASHG